MRRPVLKPVICIMVISIHAPLTGCDRRLCRNNACEFLFQSTHPLRDATQSVADKSNERKDFNPRTPYGMRLYLALIKTLSPIYFNPRTPYGMRLVKSAFYYAVKKISIHAPLTGCDVIDQMPEEMQKISIHAPLTGCDWLMISTLLLHTLFQSTHPLRDATHG